MSAFNLRVQPIRDLMSEKGLDAFVLRRNPNLAWAISGRAHVPTTIDAACFDLIITKDSAVAITKVVALGSSVRWKSIRAIGPRPMVMGLIAWVIVAGIALAAVQITDL